MRYLLAFSVLAFVLQVSLFAPGCASSVSQVDDTDSSMAFRGFIRSLPILKTARQWEVEEGMNLEIEHTTLDDSLGFEKHEYSIGLLNDTSQFYLVLYLTTGDAVYPAVRIFRKSGEKVADHIIAYTHCAGADCSMKNCDSYVRLDENGLSRGITYDEIECDTLSVKNFVKHFEQRETIDFDTSGNLVTKAAIE